MTGSKGVDRSSLTVGHCLLEVDRGRLTLGRLTLGRKTVYRLSTIDHGPWTMDDEQLTVGRKADYGALAVQNINYPRLNASPKDSFWRGFSRAGIINYTSST